MKMWQWITATATAGITITTFLMGLVYSQPQGKALEERVAHVETQIKEDNAKTAADIEHIRDKMDRIYELILKQK